MLYFLIIIIILLSVFAIFAAVVGISLALGMREKDACYYDPEINEWVPVVLLTEEQQYRIIPGKRKLRKISPKNHSR